MMFTLLALWLFQNPTQEKPAAVPPVVAPPLVQQPAKHPEDRLEGRIAGDPTKQPEAAPPAPESALVKPVQEPDAGWIRLNSVALIVNEEPVTMLAIRSGTEQRLHDPNRPEADAKQMFSEEITARARMMLEIQGGKDLGFDNGVIDRIVEHYLEHQAETAGSITQLAADLKKAEIDFSARREAAFARVNSELWSYSVTGLGQGPAGRVWRDRYVRPGLALFNQREALRAQPANRTVQFTQLIIEVGNAADPDGEGNARKQIEGLRERIENGEDMGELAEMFGHAKKGSRGLGKPAPVAGMVRAFPDVGHFLEHAAVGELSAVIPLSENGKLVAFLIVRPEEFSMPRVEAFDNAKSQAFWIEAQRARIEDTRLQQGLMELLTAAYVWPPETFSQNTKKP